MSEGAGVRLAWVLHEGRPCPVSQFAGVAPQDRPVVRCPLCRREVVLRLGDQLAHHAAHRAGDDCAVTAPESALHLNCKLHIAACLQAGAGPEAGLRLREPCAAQDLRPVGCLGHVERPWLVGWDAVAVELELEGRRPDITILDGQGRPLAAIEIHVRSPVTDAKRADLARAGLSWAEVAGHPDLLLWGLPHPLPAERSAPAPPLRCETCALRRARRSAAPQSPWLQTLHAFRTSQEDFAHAALEFPATEALLLAARPLDRYLPSAPRVERDALFIARRRTEPPALLVGLAAPLRVLYTHPDQHQDAGQALPLLRDWSEEYLSHLGRVWIVDAPGGWCHLSDLLADAGWRAAWARQGALHRDLDLRRLLGESPTATVASTDALAYLLQGPWQRRAHRYVWRPPLGGWIDTRP